MTAKIINIRRALEHAAEPSNSVSMADYMRNQFMFLGVRAPELRKATKPILTELRDRPGVEIIEIANDCWQQPEREFQYFGALLLRQNSGGLVEADIDALKSFIIRKSWWDTVDSLAAWTLGPLVKSNPKLVEVIDRWIEQDNIWLARAAILHQLNYGQDTNTERLFSYATLRAGDQEFFIRKAIGWALRQYARHDPKAISRFVDANSERLSPLTKSEALKHIQ